MGFQVYAGELITKQARKSKDQNHNFSRVYFHFIRSMKKCKVLITSMVNGTRRFNADFQGLSWAESI